jgi:hypothetical protein
LFLAGLSSDLEDLLGAFLGALLGAELSFEG